MIGTKAEAARGSKFCDIYMKAWSDAYFGKDNSCNDSTNAPIISGSTFDVSG